MQYPSLSYFLIVAEFENISQAAQYIHISQQGLSSYIKKLEEYYGVELFVRRPNLALTPAGRVLLEAARRIDRIHAEAEAEMRAGRLKSAALTMGLVSPVVRYHMSRIPLVRYRNLYPDVTVNTVEDSAQGLEQQLLARQIDFYLGNAPVDDPRLDSAPVFEQHFCLTVLDRVLKIYFPEEYPRCILRFEKGADLLEFSPMPYFGYPPSIRLTQQVDALLEGTGVLLNVAGQSVSLEINMQMVLLGEGFTLAHAQQIESYRRAARETGELLHAFPLAHPELVVPIYLVRRKGEAYPEYTENMMKMILLDNC